ncbi:MAG TPA: valine--tRNA ligase [Bryobacteraceae bacterium]|nr:valine--tRNA ligase [Bryobacteraceae bacterium]
MQLEKVYEPQQFEPYWAQWWIDRGIFRAQPKSGGRTFSIVIPPPNVTGVLHMGHMLNHTEIDSVVRWHRMRGDNTLWLPGTDHAGIATQMVVERQLATEGKSRQDLGREEFEKRVWQWKAESGGTIVKQMIRLGASCDWSRERFTLDPGLSRAVRETFVRLYEKGLVYRGDYMVNWCPRCQTAISDLETVHEETQGHLWHIGYPVEGSEDQLVVATTRPETMLGDTAVAIHPNDERYRHLHGKQVRLPLMNRLIPIITDELADPEFGTGVVKVTPAHDPNDFEAGKRHNLPHVKVIDEKAQMTAAAGEWAGMDRFEARKSIVAALEAQGLLRSTQDHKLPLGRCQRCRTPVEPLVSTQWFVSMKPLAEPAIRVVEDGRVQMIPDHWTKTYYEWMYNIRDWCISRQLWWGHRIPAWHCANGHITVAREDPSECATCGTTELKHDPDVLDTWFSSGLWPFSTLGWPDATEDLAAYYPGSLLITGFDILFFWVARMIFFGLECTGDVPFRQVYLHGMVRDAEGQKMSKTKGNVIDPLEVTEKYGTDAVRMALLMGAAPGTDIAIGRERIESARAFANKIWNASRLIFLRRETSGIGPWLPGEVDCCLPVADENSFTVQLEDRWIFSRLNRCAETVNRAMEQHRFHEVAQTLWGFFWHEFCDWYLEIKKLRLVDESGLTSDWRNLLTAYELALRMLHPVMPFVTEELWQRLALDVPDRPESIALAHFPAYDANAAAPDAEYEMSVLQDMVSAAREIRADLKLDPKLTLDAAIVVREPARALVEAQKEAIEKLAGMRYTVEASSEGVTGVKRSTPEFDLIIKVSAEQAAAQQQRLRKEVERLEKLIANSERQLADETFVSRAPEHVVDSIRMKLIEYKAQLSKHRESLQ